MATHLKQLNTDSIQEIENVEFVNRMPESGSVFIVKTNSKKDEGKPSVIDDLAFGTHFCGWKPLKKDAVTVRGFKFTSHKSTKCTGVAYCLTCNETPENGDVYSKKFNYCRKTNPTTGKLCSAELQKTSEKECPHEVRWFRTEADDNGDMMNIILFIGNHIHKQVITGKFTKKAEAMIEEHVKKNPRVKSAQLKKRPSFGNAAKDCTVLLNKDAVAAQVRKIKDKTYGQNKFKDMEDLDNALIEAYQKEHKNDKRVVLGRVSRELGVSIYLRRVGTEQQMRVMIMQTPLQSNLAVDSPTVFHIDGMHQRDPHDASGQLYHISISIWSDRMDESITVFRARVPNLTASAHQLVVSCFLKNLKEDVANFNLTKWLEQDGTGFVTDFSDAEINGTRAAIKEVLNSEETRSFDIDKKFKGCDFHYQQNVNKLIRKSNLLNEQTKRLKKMLASVVHFTNRELALDIFKTVKKDPEFKTFHSLFTFLKWWKARVHLLVNPHIRVTTNNIAESTNASLRMVIEDPNLSIEFRNSFDVDVGLFTTLLARESGLPTTWRLSNQQALYNRKKWKYHNDGVPQLSGGEKEVDVRDEEEEVVRNEEEVDGDCIDEEDEDDEEEVEEDEDDEEEEVDGECVDEEEEVVSNEEEVDGECIDEEDDEEDDEEEERRNKKRKNDEKSKQKRNKIEDGGKKSYWSRFNEEVNKNLGKRKRNHVNYKKTHDCE